MIRRLPRSTRTDPFFPYTTLFRACLFLLGRRNIGEAGVDAQDAAAQRILICLVDPLLAPVPSASRTQLDDLRTAAVGRSEEHTSELQSLMRISYAVFCLKKKIIKKHKNRQ